MELSLPDKRIEFHGEEKDINRIYALSDYIIRGEIDFRIGRTIFEALYADCDVILPSSDKEIEREKDLRVLRDKVHIYTPRDRKSLTTVIESVSGNLKRMVLHAL